MSSFSTFDELTSILKLSYLLGWWLSLKPEDSFFRRMDDLDKIPEMLDKKTDLESGIIKHLGCYWYELT